MQPGEIYRHEAFYLNRDTGELEPKYLMLLAAASDGDFVARLLTSRPHGRPEHPTCFHGHPYSSFFLGTLGGPLSAKSWLDLRYLEDFDGVEFERRVRSKRIKLIMSIANQMLVDSLTCAAGAEDTSRFQERAIRDQISRLR